MDDPFEGARLLSKADLEVYGSHIEQQQEAQLNKYIASSISWDMEANKHSEGIVCTQVTEGTIDSEWWTIKIPDADTKVQALPGKRLNPATK